MAAQKISTGFRVGLFLYLLVVFIWLLWVSEAPVHLWFPGFMTSFICLLLLVLPGPSGLLLREIFHPRDFLIRCLCFTTWSFTSESSHLVSMPVAVRSSPRASHLGQLLFCSAVGGIKCVAYYEARGLLLSHTHGPSLRGSRQVVYHNLSPVLLTDGL